MRKGVLLAAAAGISWGTIPLAVKHIYSIGSANAVQISFFRFAIAFLVLGVITQMRHAPCIIKNKWSILMGFWGIFWMSALSFYGLRYTSAVNATILFNANPLFVVLLVVLLKWEKVRFWTVAGIFLGITGVVLVSGRATINIAGDVLVLAGAFGWAVYTVVGYKLRGLPSLSITTSSLVWGLLFFIPLTVKDIPHITGPAWMWIFYIGLIPTAAAFVSYIKAVDLIGSTKASVFQYLAPAVAVLISWGLGLEQVTFAHIAGILLIITGIELTRRAGTINQVST